MVLGLAAGSSYREPVLDTIFVLHRLYWPALKQQRVKVVPFWNCLVLAKWPPRNVW